MDILLIHPPTVLDAEQSKKSIMSSIMIGYGMLSIGAFLEKQGYKVEIFNIPYAYSLGFTEDNIFNLFKSYSPKLIGIELNWLQFSKGAIECAKKLKEIFPNTPIVMGGVNATIFAREILEYYNKFIDAIFIGESELTFLDYINNIENNGDLTKIRGILRKDENNRTRDQGPARIFKNIDEIPPYKLNIVKPRLIPPYDIGMINTCRGPCIHNCFYCIGNRNTYSTSLKSSRTNLDIHSPEWIVSQIQILLRDVKKLSIQDYIYCKPKKVLQIAKAMQKEGLDDKIEYFNFAALPGSLNKEILTALSKAGIDNIDFGVESGSQNILKIIKRPYTIPNVIDSIKSSIESGILPKTYWLVGLPFETESDIEKTKELIIKTIKLGALPKWVTPLCLFPGLELFENAKKYGIKLRLKKFQDFFTFSTTQRNIDSWYPSVITHETENFTINDILKKSLELKKFISTNSNLILTHQMNNLENYFKFHPKFDENKLIQRIKMVLSLLKYTFF
ncbi:MAG: radical SAM protein [Candidatus Helarchaeota archaeon]|nr:radical SAM protein [Candidatus Helarchaeota archaeon]